MDWKGLGWTVTVKRFRSMCAVLDALGLRAQRWCVAACFQPVLLEGVFFESLVSVVVASLERGACGFSELGVWCPWSLQTN